MQQYNQMQHLLHKVLSYIYQLKYANYIGHICCVCHMFDRCICTTWEATCISHVIKNTVYIFFKLHFIILAHITEEMWLPYCTYMLHCPHIWIYGYRVQIPLSISEKTQPTTASTSYHIVPTTLNIYVIFAKF